MADSLVPKVIIVEYDILFLGAILLSSNQQLSVDIKLHVALDVYRLKVFKC